MKEKVVIHWFRQDLRLSDNPALSMAAKLGTVLPIYIWDDTLEKDQQLGAASRVWLHYSLTALNESLGQALQVFKGAPLDILRTLCQQYTVTDICYNTVYSPYLQAKDTVIKAALLADGIGVHTYNASLLWDPEKIKKEDGNLYTVFTPFYRKGCLGSAAPEKPLARVNVGMHQGDKAAALRIEDLSLLANESWYKTLMGYWTVGEAGAQQVLASFLKDGIQDYKKGRNFPDKKNASRLSVYIRFGEISVRQIWHTIQQLPQDKNTDHFCSELGWREFSYYLLFHHPDLNTENLQRQFDKFPWLYDAEKLQAWQRGQTGAPQAVLEKANVRLGIEYPFPIVDFEKTRMIAENAFEALKETL